jgi:molybdenum cofactor cytidylyltransferase
MPPALFGARHFGALEALSGTGARARCWLTRLALPPGAELDVDRPEDLARARSLRSGLRPAFCDAEPVLVGRA